MKIYFIRHFKTKGNMEKRYIGKTDESILPVITETKYPKAQIVFTSEYKRTFETANLIYKSLTPYKYKELNETDFGDFENKNFHELEKNEDYKNWLLTNGEGAFPNGESKEKFAKRTLKGFFKALEYASEKGCDELAFIIHGGSIMVILSTLAGGNFYDYHVENGCGYETRYENNLLKVIGEIK